MKKSLSFLLYFWSLRLLRVRTTVQSRVVDWYSFRRRVVGTDWVFGFALVWESERTNGSFFFLVKSTGGIEQGRSTNNMIIV